MLWPHEFCVTTIFGTNGPLLWMMAARILLPIPLVVQRLSLQFLVVIGLDAASPVGTCIPLLVGLGPLPAICM